MKVLVTLIMITTIVLFTGCDEDPQYLPSYAENPSTSQAQEPESATNPTSNSVTEYVQDNYEPEYVEDNTDYAVDTHETEYVDNNAEYTQDNNEPEELPTLPEPEIAAGERGMIVLTFDDGPSQYTDYILDLLERYNARATFFVLGYRLERRRDTVLRAVNIGSEVAGHTWSHRRLSALCNQGIAEAIQNTSAAIEEITGVRHSFFRPPYGLVNRNVAEVSAELGYTIINWTLDTMDWKYRDADTIYNTIMRQVRDGSIILMHDIHPTTMAAMERVIPSLIARGYQLVTVSELMYHLYGGELEPGLVYGSPRKVS
ncbi:MAG: polysaccharide deacetylase family protein [Oscillospiraceae bacterium]|nr:polysaccharide deacetylase family protein [Oscillospiraceae bacterium]